MKITKRQLRKIIKESILAEGEMQDIIVNSYEDVEDYNVLANYALANDIQGALADPTIKHYVDKNEMGWFADDAITWLRWLEKMSICLHQKVGTEMQHSTS